MTKLMEFDRAKEILAVAGYVRVGDHAATSMEELEAIYLERQDAWESAEVEGFVPRGPGSVAALPGVLGSGSSGS